MVTTIDGYTIELITASRPLTSTDISLLNSQCVESNPNAVLRYSPNSYYNCHSYAWYQTSNSNPYWIIDVDTYVKGVHKKVHTDTTSEVGDIVVYHNSSGEKTHSAIIVSISSSGVITCESKWGMCGVYRHAINDVPELYYEGYTEPKYKIYKTYKSHYYSLKDVSSTAHTQICNFCSYTITSAHTYLTSSYNSSTHTRVCKVCDHTITESHTPNSAGTLCTGCSFTGPFSSIIQKLPEDTELQTLLPEPPSLCCDDHAVH